MNIILSKRLITVFCLTLLLVIGNAVISYKSIQTLIYNNGLVMHTQEVLSELNQVLSTMKDAETGQRGFIITGSEVYLEPYQSARAQIGENVRRLKELTLDNQNQQRRIPELESSINEKFKTLEAGLDLQRSGGSSAVRQSGLLEKGRIEMEAVRKSVSEMEREENYLLAMRTEEAKVSGRNSFLTFLLANGIMLALLVIVFYLVNRDIGERARSEAALREANDRLENRVIERTAELNKTNVELARSNRELQDFAFVASHDLQEPLRKIQAFGDRLRIKQGANLGDEGRDHLERMQNAARRMQTLINDLLTFSRVTTKAQPFVTVNLEKVAEEVLEDLETRIQQTGGRVEVENLPVIDADPLQMRQLLQNLIGNALKFHRAGAPPVVKVMGSLLPVDKIVQNDSKSGLCRIKIEDNGIGFDEKYLDRIFTPFQRLHARGEYEGTGMGLAVCRKITERHGGSITAESAPDAGTTFIVTLPVKQNQEN